jgi:hypothetical protein
MQAARDPLSSLAAQAEAISKPMRVSLWFIAWGLAASATVAPAFALLLFCWLFPLGLAAPLGASDWTSPVATYGTLFAGWSLYITLSIFGLKQRQRARYFWAYSILLLLLAANAAGCRYEVTHMHLGC